MAATLPAIQWLMESDEGTRCSKEPSADACDHYHRYPDDIAMLKGLGFNTYRFSIEWARIEPEEGFFSKAALGHYRRMIATCLAMERGADGDLPPFHRAALVLRDGGWENPNHRPLRALLRSRLAAALGDLIPYACTINEANIPIMVTMMRRAVGIAERRRQARTRSPKPRACAAASPQVLALPLRRRHRQRPPT